MPLTNLFPPKAENFLTLIDTYSTEENDRRRGFWLRIFISCQLSPSRCVMQERGLRRMRFRGNSELESARVAASPAGIASHDNCRLSWKETVEIGVEREAFENNKYLKTTRDREWLDWRDKMLEFEKVENNDTAMVVDGRSIVSLMQGDHEYLLAFRMNLLGRDTVPFCVLTGAKLRRKIPWQRILILQYVLSRYGKDHRVFEESRSHCSLSFQGSSQQLPPAGIPG